ncbi:MAG: hypothetical protein AB3N09_13590 [Tateyamaria sp.]
MHKTCIIGAFVVLAACGDPLRGIERVSEGAELPPEPGAAALPSEAELSREDGLLAGLFQSAPADPVVSAEAPETAAVGESADPEAAVAGPSENSDLVLDVADTNDADAANPETATVLAAEPETRGRAGMFGWLRRAGGGDVEEPVVVETVAEPIASEETELVALEPQPSDLVEPEKRRSLFGAPRQQDRTGPDARDVAKGSVLPFGEIARVCDVRGKEMGKVVDKAARKGRGYLLFDTAPDTTTPRTFYVTGFADNCPRQFTASLALFGDPAFHEQLRYGLPAEEYPYSTTDKAYEKLKRKVCNVGRNTPCGGRIDRLTKTTTFISAYENFTDNARWADMLLHDGAVLATALKTP